MANASNYKIELKTSSEDAVPNALQPVKYWYDTGSEYNDEAIYYDNATAGYAIWYESDVYDAFILTESDNVGEDFEASGAVVFEGPSDSPAGNYVGDEGASGTITTSAYTIADAWYRAETTAFDSLKNFLGTTEGVNCFRGFLPVQGDADDYLDSDIWQMTSGTDADFDISDTFGSDALWCSFQAAGRIESVWETREGAMKFAGAVTAWLKETGNLAETGNVTWCTLAAVPDEPVIYRTQGANRERYWEQTIDLTLTYRTENVYV